MPTLGAKDAPKMGHPDFWNCLDLGHPPEDGQNFCESLGDEDTPWWYIKIDPGARVAFRLG
jgi:hypothetical protein